MVNFNMLKKWSILTCSRDGQFELKENLCDEKENPLVRHECAEALGAIATEECTNILEQYLKDKERVVKESCIVALDMCEYEQCHP
jgi:deoxyhypusine monooxygenase